MRRFAGGSLVRRTTTAAALLALTAGCGTTSGEGSAEDPGAARTATSPTVSPGRTTGSETVEPDSPAESESRLPPVRHPVSLARLMREKFTGGRIDPLRVVAANESYTRYEVTFPSGDVTVSGVLLRPRGKGAFPAVVLNHGYIDPAVYVTGQGMMREQDYLARAGFVVLHVDYRGHAGSDPAPPQSLETRLGYTEDAINAVRSLQRLRYVDPDRIGMVGRSMGGGVTYNALVVEPGLVDAAVVFAPVSSRFLDNFRRWTVAERPVAAAATYRRYGTPEESPGFYRGLSPRTYFDRITEPVLIHHGTSDDSCPIRWSRQTQRLLQRAGVASSLEVYPGEEHAFGPQWPQAMERTVRFLRSRLKG